LDVIGQARHEIAGFHVLEVIERQLLQMSKYPVAKVGFAAARETVDVDAPEVAEKPLQRRGTENQQRILEQGTIGVGADRRIDAALDQPGQGDTREIGSDERENAKDEKTPVAINKELDAVVVAENRRFLWVMTAKWPSVP
jgi:hypothetical protein